jgi:hypothetical protein
MITELKKRPGPSKGCRAIEKKMRCTEYVFSENVAITFLILANK